MGESTQRTKPLAGPLSMGLQRPTLIVPGSGLIELYNDSDLMNSGLNKIVNVTPYSDVGVYNITIVYPMTENFTRSDETHFVEVVDTTVPWMTLKAILIPP